MIENLKDLKNLMVLCRKQGIRELELGTIKLKLGDLPETIAINPSNDDEDKDDPYSSFPDVVLTPEQLMFYSSGGLPENDKELED